MSDTSKQQECQMSNGYQQRSHVGKVQDMKSEDERIGGLQRDGCSN
jgi:hypothetical protein